MSSVIQQFAFKKLQHITIMESLPEYMNTRNFPSTVSPSASQVRASFITLQLMVSCNWSSLNATLPCSCCSYSIQTYQLNFTSSETSNYPVYSLTMPYVSEEVYRTWCDLSSIPEAAIQNFKQNLLFSFDFHFFHYLLNWWYLKCNHVVIPFHNCWSSNDFSLDCFLIEPKLQIRSYQFCRRRKGGH